MIAVGVDTHKHEHAVCVLDALGQLIGERTVSADRRGYGELAGWIGELADEVLVAIEGAASYGAGLCEYLLGPRAVLRRVIFGIDVPKGDHGGQTGAGEVLAGVQG